MFIVGLTGGIGSGKSEAAKIFAELGVPITDLDVISHQLTAANEPLVAQIKAIFGDTYITKDSALNRPAMRSLIFNDINARKQLNALLHPAIYAQALAQLHTNKTAAYQILAIPLLAESPRYLPHIAQILVIDCDEKTQITRVRQRSQLSTNDIQKIINAQTPREQLLLLADDVIVNNANIDQLREKILLIHEKYLNTCIVSKST
jgi:dephospho-CoA kinase